MKVLLTGANGYIGRRLKHILMQQDEVTLKLLVRNPKSLNPGISEHVEVVQGDTFDTASLNRALKGVDTAYYLIHSLGSKNYRELDKQSAQNFLDAAIRQGVKRIVYLGGLGVKKSASEHLLSRIETGEILSSRPDEIQTIWIRAGVIIGSGSASFEIVRHLVEKLPVMVTPKWVTTMAQPIAVDDVVRYLDSAKDLTYDKNLIVDIGSQKMRYKEMMLQTASALGLKRYIFPLPVLTINLSSYWLNIFTPVPYKVAKSLIEGLGSEVVVQNDHAKIYFPLIKPIFFYDAVKRAIDEMHENQVFSRWSDAGGDVVDEWENFHKNDPSNAVFTDRKTMPLTDTDAVSVYKAFTSIGGKEGWFGYSWLWSIRGLLDKLVGGAGLNRGRRDAHNLRVGDSLDFWKVEDLTENRRLLLRAQMKVPGHAWLEFAIKDDTLIQTAYFYPRGIWGRLYWYALVPIHFLVFGNMIQSIIKKSKTIYKGRT